MSNMSEKKNLDQNTLPYLSVQANWRSNRGNVHLLMKKLKNSKKVRKQIVRLKQDVNKPDFGRE